MNGWLFPHPLTFSDFNVLYPYGGWWNLGASAIFARPKVRVAASVLLNS